MRLRRFSARGKRRALRKVQRLDATPRGRLDAGRIEACWRRSRKGRFVVPAEDFPGHGMRGAIRRDIERTASHSYVISVEFLHVERDSADRELHGPLGIVRDLAILRFQGVIRVRWTA